MDTKTEKKETGIKHKPGGSIERPKSSWLEGSSPALPLLSAFSRSHPPALSTQPWPGVMFSGCHPASLALVVLTHCSSEQL